MMINEGWFCDQFNYTEIWTDSTLASPTSPPHPLWPARHRDENKIKMMKQIASSKTPPL